MKKIFLITALILFSQTSIAGPIVSGISTNQINIDTKFNGTELLLFGAKSHSGNIIVAVRGPKKNFIITKKDKLFGFWYSAERVKLKDTYSFYSLFSTLSSKSNIDHSLENTLSNLEIGTKNLHFNISKDVELKKQDEFKEQMISYMEGSHLYSTNVGTIDFLDETLFKVVVKFPKNITRGTYNVEIYLIDENRLLSFQSIPIYVTQSGISATILDFSYQEPFLYGLLAVILALACGWLVNYIFNKIVSK
jgi:uncharacterized protein (TIGR02186 family)